MTVRGIVNDYTGKGGENTTFTNAGQIAIGALSSAGVYGIENRAKFSSTGLITLDDVTTIGLYNTATFTLGGRLVTGSIRATGTYGIYNEGLLTVQPCGSLVVASGRFVNSSAKGTTNEGYVSVASTLGAPLGSFTNNGVLKYGGTTGNVVNNSLVINDKPNPTFQYGASFTGTVNGIFTDEAGTQSAGSIVAPDIIVPSIPPGDYTLYARVTPQSGGCAHMVPFTYTAEIPAPNILVSGNNIDISNGDTTPDASDHNAFGPLSYVAGQVVRRFTVRNTGNVELNLSGTPKISLDNSGDFTVTSQPASPVAIDGNTFFEISFDPASAGVKTAVVSISNDLSGKNPYTFTINGEGSNICNVVVTTGRSPGPGLSIPIGTNLVTGRRRAHRPGK